MTSLNEFDVAALADSAVRTCMESDPDA